MKSKLREALEDKKDFEIEFLQLQKNYLKAKNENKLLKDNNSDGLTAQLKAAKTEIDTMKKRLNDKIDDVPDTEQIAALKK